MKSSSPFFVFAAAALATCGCAPADLGQDPNFIWWTDHETGNLADWDQGGSHWTYPQGGANLEVVTLPNPTRSGKYSLMSSVRSQATGIQAAAQTLRTSGLPEEAYYSAWYYLPAPITQTTYWAFFQYRSRNADNSTVFNVWDLEVLVDDNGAMYLSLYLHAFGSVSAARTDAHTPSIPIGQWFQVEAFLRAVNDTTGRLTIWLNGTQIFDVLPQQTMPSSYIEWVVGGLTESINPDPAVVFIDDAAVTKRQLGPNFPVFWRGN